MPQVDDPSNVGETIRQLLARVRALETANPIANASSERGRLRMYDNAELLIEGLLDVTGTASVTGDLDLTGDMDVTGGGKITVHGGVDAVLGQTTWGLPGLQFGSAALVSLLGVLGVVNSTGGVGVGPTFARMSWSSRSVEVTSTGTQVTGPLDVNGAFTATSKSFRIVHPTKPDMMLLHGVTESPVHGVEYWGDDVIGADGSAVVELPEYFEALTAVDGRSVFVTGRGFAADWDDIADGQFRVYGSRGDRFSWLVKAARADVTLVTEEPIVRESTQ